MDELFGHRKQRLLGRGTAALWVALEAIARRDGHRGEVVLPDMVCPDVLEAVLLAGYTPRLADVDAGTYTVTPATLQPLLGDRTQAIIVVHLFGHAAPVEAVAELARARGSWLIEDAVQGIGGRTPAGNPIGEHGDFAFVSFAPTKMIRGEGALLLYDDERWTPLVEAAAESITSVGVTTRQRLLDTSRRDLYHGLGQALRLGVMDPETAAAAFHACVPVYASLLLRRFDDSPENVALIREEWESLPARVERRREKAAALRQALAGLPVEQPCDRAGDAVWRHTVRFPTGEAADSFVSSLRRAGGLASHLYYPLNQLYSRQEAFRSNDLARRLVNLWVDDRVDSDYPALVGEVARATLDGVS